MSVVPAAIEPGQTAERGRARAGARVRWLVIACYLLAAFLLTWRLWADPAGRAQVGDPEDVDLFAWFLRYAAAAVSHGHLPALVTTAMNAPRGINMMGNTSFLLPGMLLTPVTLLAGPQVSLTLLLTLGFAGSAATLFWVLNRWGAGLAAAGLGGAFYGFSTALLDSGVAHYNVQFAVLPPLIIHMVLRIATGRNGAGQTEQRIPWRAGIWLGLLAAAQVFIGEELLADTALAAVLIVAMLAVSFPRAAQARARDAALGLGAAVAVAAAICGRPLWVQLRGPLSSHGTWEVLDTFTSHFGALVNPPGSLLLHTRDTVTATGSGSSNFITEYLGYLGWPLLVVLVAAAVCFWRDPRVRIAAVTWAVLEWLSLGGQSRTFLGVRFPGALLPWHWLEGLPLVGEMLPDRIAVVADGAAAALLAFSLQRACSAVPRSWGRPGTGLVFGAAVLALVPLIPLPIQAGTVPPVPAGWQAAFARLRLAPDAPVLVVPVPYSHRPEVIRWQAETGQPGSFAGGWFVGPDQTGQATIEYFGPPEITPFFLYLDKLWLGQRAGAGPPPAQVRAALSYLRPAAVAADTTRGSPLARYLTSVLGQPSFTAGSMVVWRR